MLPYVRLIRSRAPARASGAHSPESLAAKEDRSALSRGAGNVRRGDNSRGCCHLMDCARHDPHHVKVPPPLIEAYDVLQNARVKFA